MGNIRLESRNGSRVADLIVPGSPAYGAGLERDDELRQIDGRSVRSDDDVAAVLQRHHPGDSIAVIFANRTGLARTAAVTLVENPELEVVPVESTGGTLTAAERSLRQSWLTSRAPSTNGRPADAQRVEGGR